MMLSARKLMRPKSPQHASRFVSFSLGVITTSLLATFAISEPVNAATPEVIGWGFNHYGQLNAPADLTNVIALSAAGGFADVDGAYVLALTREGRVAAWGNVGFGQTSVPASLTNAVAIAAATYHALALTSEGKVVAWGHTNYGSTIVPPGLSNVVAIAAGAYHSLALTGDGTVISWGTGPPVPIGLSNVIAIDAGYSFSVALKADGRVEGWGATQPPAGLSNIVAIEAGDAHCLALKNDGTVVAWGHNLDFAATVPVGLTNVASIAAGGRVSLALKTDGTVVGWGFWDTTDVPPALNPAATITAGHLYCIGLRGNTDNGIPEIVGEPVLIGTASRAFTYRITAKNNPTNFAATGLPPGLLLDPATGIISGAPNQIGKFSVQFAATNAAGSSERTFTMHVNAPLPAIRNGGLVQGYPGQPFHLALIADNEPAWISAAGVPNGVALDAQAGAIAGVAPFTIGDFPVTLLASNAYGIGSRALTLRLSSVIGWGADGSGQITGAGPLSNIVAIAAGANHSLALAADGRVISFGSQSPMPDGLSNAVAIVAGAQHSVALRADGTVVTWGSNFYGQTNVPAGLSNVVAIAAGEFHSLGLRRDGTLVGWGGEGRIDYGQASIPSTLSNVMSMAGGREHTVVLRRDGTVLAWGRNASGETNVPSGLSNVVAVAAGGSHCLALLADGTVVSWGAAGTTQGTVPSGLSNVVAIAAAVGQNLALKRDGSVVGWGINDSPPADMRNVMAIAAGGSHGLALLRTTPRLEVRRTSANSAEITWSAGARNWLLEETATLNVWTNSTLSRIEDGTNVFVNVILGPTNRFFRLVQP